MEIIKNGAFIDFLTGDKKTCGGDAIAIAERLDIRGHGGAGFSAAEKMKLCKSFDGEKTVVCNAYGAKDGLSSQLVSAAPWALAEGLKMAAGAVGAEKTAIYYNSGDKSVESALKTLGDVELFAAPDRLSFGEESIMLNIMADEPPISRIRPPYPAENGKLVFSAETLCALAFAAAEGKKAGKLVLVSGAVSKPGIAEAEEGCALGTLLEAAGGVSAGEFKAFFVGDPLGRVTAEMGADALKDIGNGRITVLSDKSCVLHELKTRLAALITQSCGKCTLCREGVRQMAMLIENMTNGRGRPDDIELLREVAEVVRDGASCGFGRLAANMALTALDCFMGEFENHLRKKRCDAMVCRQYTSFHILGAKCKGCGDCMDVCPEDAIDGEEDYIHVINQVDCTRCGKCAEVCRYDAIVQAGAIKPRCPEEPVPVGSWRGR